jgi:hypothetical protein
MDHGYPMLYIPALVQQLFYLIHRATYIKRVSKVTDLCCYLHFNSHDAPEPFSVSDGSFVKNKFNFGKQNIIDPRCSLKSKQSVSFHIQPIS